MMILGIGQWLIDTVGKLGPLSIAVAVYLANKRQNLWNSGAVVRTANLEDQKMRLALLDRRLTVIQHLRTARDEVGPTRKGSEALGALLDALREAELIFEDEEQLAIKGCLNRIIRYQTQFGSRFFELTSDELMVGVTAYQGCIGDINVVMDRLREASRMSTLAPLTAPD